VLAEADRLDEDIMHRPNLRNRYDTLQEVNRLLQFLDRYKYHSLARTVIATGRTSG